jgi:hypothetical protein
MLDEILKPPEEGALVAPPVARQVVKHFASTDKTRTLTHYAEDS